MKGNRTMGKLDALKYSFEKERILTGNEKLSTNDTQFIEQITDPTETRLNDKIEAGKKLLAETADGYSAEIMRDFNEDWVCDVFVKGMYDEVQLESMIVMLEEAKAELQAKAEKDEFDRVNSDEYKEDRKNEQRWEGF